MAHGAHHREDLPDVDAASSAHARRSQGEAHAVRGLLAERERLCEQLAQVSELRLAALRGRISAISRRIQRITREQARHVLADAYPWLVAETLAGRLRWTDGREIDGLPFAGRARWGDLLLNYRVQEGRQLLVVIHYIHPVGPLMTLLGQIGPNETVGEACARLLEQRA